MKIIFHTPNSMRYIALFFVLILALSSCQKTIDTPTTNTGTTSTGGNLEFSTVEDIKVDTSLSYEYYDPVEDNTGSLNFGEYLAKNPYTIIYFYPKDGTPNCTIQGGDFSRMQTEFLAAGYQIIGVSREDGDSHKEFCEKNNFTIPLISDTQSNLLKQFRALGPLVTYGNGDDKSDIIRSTFIVDSTGKPMYAFRNVNAIGHAQAIYDLISKK